MKNKFSHFKKALILVVYSVIFISSFNSCATFHTGSYVSSVSLSEPNYIYIKKASGSSSVTYFLGLGGSGKSTMIEHAKEDLYRNANLKDNQEIANVTISETFSTVILFSSKRIEIHADVIEWVTDSTEDRTINLKKSIEKYNLEKLNNFTDEEKIKLINYVYNYSNSMMKEYNSDAEIKVGDIVYVKPEKKAGIIISAKSRVYTIESFDKEGNKTVYEKTISQIRKIIR